MSDEDEKAFQNADQIIDEAVMAHVKEAHPDADHPFDIAPLLCERCRELLEAQERLYLDLLKGKL